MRRNKALFLIVLALVMILIGGTFVVILKYRTPDIKTFEVSEFQYYIGNFPSEEILGSISDSKDLIKKVEIVWIKKYGKNVKSQKPYQVFYDEGNDIWLIQGSLRNAMMGGVANIIVDNDTGKVLAIWHEK